MKDDDDTDELYESLQDLIIDYRIQEQQKNSEINQENAAKEDEEDDDEDDVNLQRILKQIGVSLHNKYRQKGNLDQSSTKLSNVIQQLYQTLKKTQPQLFTKQTRIDKSSTENFNHDKQTSTDTTPIEETEDEEENDEEEILPLTPEMEHANILYHQAMKLINVTINRQYES